MVLYPTSDVSKAAAKVLKKDLKVQLTADLAMFLNQEFAKSVGKFAQPSHLKSLVGQYYQQQSNQFLDTGSSETDPNK
jgi:hypothetical protein